MIELDGAQGEGGGQVLRSALALSVCTQQPFHISDIRISRDMPGLLRQHIAAVNAAADIANAEVQGAQLGSRELTFRPRQAQAGNYEFAVAAGGSCSLVLQTVMPPLLLAKSPSSVRITGGTHSANAPPFDHLQRTFAPLLERMGAQVQLGLIGYAFHPHGGGGIQADIAPSTLTPIDLHERGARISRFAEASIAGIPVEVAQRELATLGRQLQWTSDQLHLRTLPPSVGKGNVLTVTLAYQHIVEVFSGFVEQGVRADAMSHALAQEVENYLNVDAPVGTCLADQLLLPMALCGRGSFTATSASTHLRTNAAVIEQFMGRRIAIEAQIDAFRISVA